MNHLASSLNTNPDVLLTEMKDGTGVLLHMRTKFYYTLNPTGVFLWKTLEKSPGANIDALAQALESEFEVARDESRADIEAILGQLLDEQLVVANA